MLDNNNNNNKQNIQKNFKPGPEILKELYEVICDRKVNRKEGSYTNYLFDKGLDKILKKVGEEASEVIIAAKNNSFEEVKYEISDLIYHLFVLMVEQGLKPEDIYEELRSRR
ncbi:MAG: phosphoribosyl-ATP diphosphatase [Clostridiaceae bacterium]|jgi:phosphoribosyl-ATP pyrophosphohydrolase/phosphoribosyl-AMP cyclohydrolase|nr:phosphoribosyl-ATP diphosphatase [Clostridiaceae bacterium]